MTTTVKALKEQWTLFFPNVILGFNDAIISLTGALVGFSFALSQPRLVAVVGVVTGLSASMSMAASAYQQARHEARRSPAKAALFTGASYLVIALALVLPFVWASDIGTALGAMALVTLALVATVSFYSASLLKRRYVAQLGEMLLSSLGVAVVTFLIGHALGVLVGSG